MPISKMRIEAPEPGTESALLLRKEGIVKGGFEINLPSSDIRVAEALLTVKWKTQKSGVFVHDLRAVPIKHRRNQHI